MVQTHRLLAYEQHPDQVQMRPPLAEQLAVLDRAPLQALLLELAHQAPRLNEMIEAALPLDLDTVQRRE